MLGKRRRQEEDEEQDECSCLKESNDILPSLRSLFQRGLLLDATVRSGASSIDIHGVVFAARSEVCCCRLGTNRSILDLSDIISPDHLSFLVNFMYGLPTPVHNPSDMLHVGHLLGISQLKEVAASSLCNSLSVQNCISTLLSARDAKCDSLISSSASFIGKNMRDVSSEEEFLHLSSEVLVSILSLDDLAVECEEYVFEAAAAWLNYSHERQKYTELVFRQVRFPMINPRYLKSEVRPHPLVVSCPIMSDLLLEAYENHAYFSPYREEHSGSKRKRARISYTTLNSAPVCRVVKSESCSVYRVKFREFSTLSSRVYSNSFPVGGCPWCVLLYPHGNESPHLSVYLAVPKDDKTVSYRRRASFKLTLINQLHREDNVTRGSEHTFLPTDKDWGFRQFLSMERLMDGDSGYLEGDVLILDVEVNVTLSEEGENVGMTVTNEEELEEFPPDEEEVEAEEDEEEEEEDEENDELIETDDGVPVSIVQSNNPSASQAGNSNQGDGRSSCIVS